MKSLIALPLILRDEPFGALMFENSILSVRDYGPGISRQDQTRIFERFERAVDSRFYGGLGLGLYIARELAEAHGGKIWVESEVGKGSNFIVELPLELRANNSGQEEDNTRHHSSP